MTCVQNKVSSALAQTEGSSGTQIIAPTGMHQTLSPLHGFESFKDERSFQFEV